MKVKNSGNANTGNAIFHSHTNDRLQISFSFIFWLENASKMETERTKIIIDTDPGVDDAMAIMMALDAHKRKYIEIVAITLVKGNAPLKNAETNVF